MNSGTNETRQRDSVLVTAALIAVLILPNSAKAGCDPMSTEGVIGGIAGAALGGFLGSKIGSGSGRTVATIGGALAGGLLGNQAVTNLTCQDQRAVYDTTQSTLEQYPSGRAATWNNPDSGNWGTVTPTQTYVNARGQNCRQFEQIIYIDGNPETGTGVACRQPNGSWKIVEG
ncbi:glycine zipper 2TM domain-containing protein [Parvibaculum lavamentivorans]|nr:glycine zipper 2TM domain-containing protein [Parvibaculum lavamentivorans]